MSAKPPRIEVIPAGGGSKCIHPGDTVGYNVLTKAMTGGSHSVVIADAVVGAAPPYYRHTADERPSSSSKAPSRPSATAGCT